MKLQRAMLAAALSIQLAPPAVARPANDPPLVGPVWTVESDQERAHLGEVLRRAGDLNGDGLAELAIGMPDWDAGVVDAGAVWVFLGAGGGLSSTPDWSFAGAAATTLVGASVAGAGDVDGDGFGDLVVGAPGHSSGESDEGAVLLFLGSPTGPSLAPDWSFESDQVGAELGAGVAGAGDVNGDGFDDLVVGAPGHPGGGRAFLFFGSPTGPAATPDWIGDVGPADARYGAYVSGGGDVDGDGFDDLAVGAPIYTGSVPREGAVFVYHGSASGPATSADLVLSGGQHDDHYAIVAMGGDVDGDGYDDLLIGAPLFDAPTGDKGRAELFLGSAAGLPAAPAWVLDGTQGFAHLGQAVDIVPDADGDGIDEVLVGAPYFDGSGGDDVGRAWLFPGAPGGPAAVAEWQAGGGQAYSAFGSAAAGLGDVDGDGLGDVLVGARRFENPEFDEGRAFLYAGQAFTDCNANDIDDGLDVEHGTSPDCDGDGVPDECGGPALAYCSGDGTGAPCPCGNAGGAGRGCANGSASAGAVLAMLGSASVAADDARLCAGGSVPGQPGLFFQGDDATGGGAGLAFGDGLRCAGGGVVRLQVVTADGVGVAGSTVSIAGAGGATAGDTRRYQWWYRDPAGSPCGAQFNLSNGVELLWAP